MFAAWSADLEKLAAGGWSSEWPTEVGHYFVYGYPWSKPHENAKPRLYTGEVRDIRGTIYFIVNGQHAFKSEARIVVKPIRTELPEWSENNPTAA